METSNYLMRFDGKIILKISIVIIYPNLKKKNVNKSNKNNF